MNEMRARSVARVVTAVETVEGAGFIVHRPFPSTALADLDPFLLLDEMGPMELGPGEAKGAPDHPHRGFETVTYMLSGTFEHRDSRGHAGRIGPGDVQWMTAGAGVVHSEMPSAEMLRDGGRLHGFQLWVNLPRRDKMMAPRYQELAGASIPSATTDDATVSVSAIAGEAMGMMAAIETRTEIAYLDFLLRPGARWRQPVAAGHNAFAYVVAGEAEFEGKRLARGQAAIFARDGEAAELAAPADSREALRVLLISGQPLNEPVARYGPFVMNTREEVQQAFEDFRAGRMGSIA